MHSAAALRLNIENALRDRIPAALSPKAMGVREFLSCGIPALDELTQGGFPVGCITELVGPECSGRTTAAMSFLARVISLGNVVAWIDVADTFDPESAAANRIKLDRLLWIRCAYGTVSDHRQPSPTASKSAPLKRVLRETPSVPVGGGGSPHPRSEGRGMSQAIDGLLASQPRSAAMQPRRADQRIGTPGAPNRPLTPRSERREEQISTDRLPPRRGENLQTFKVTTTPYLPNEKQLAVRHSAKDAKDSFAAIERALQVADLLLQAGGFRAIVLDLGSTSVEHSWRIPLATWFRFRAACERSRVSFLLLTQHSCARSSAELVLRMETGTPVCQGAVMTGTTYKGNLERQHQHRPESNILPMQRSPRSERKPEGLWQAANSWVRIR